ncbi:MAG: PT domain-containing protein [Anaerolineae bacterium]|nr:PT domain-containing protein [Anaerolineae bacterium]
MKSKLSTLVFVLTLSAMIVSGCGTTTAEPTKVPTDTPAKVPTAIPTQVPTDTPTKVVVEVSEWVLDARDAALAYVSEQYSEEAPAPGLTWTGESTLPENAPPGWSEYQFTSGDWAITIGHAVLPPNQTVYEVAVINETTGFQWEGEVDASGEVTEILAPITKQLALCWYGRVESAPEDAALDRYLVLLPEELRQAVDAVGADEAIEAEIEGLRDSGIYAHFWGTLNCDVPGWGGCRLVVTRLRAEGPEGPFFDPDPVEGWTGSVFGMPDDAQFDDYFVLSGNVRAHYGIDSADATIAAQLESLRDTGSIVRVWGQVTCPAIDFYGTEIQVTRLEVVREAPAEEEGYKGWNTYMSERFGYALRYPGECTVMGSNLDDAVQFAGQQWPVLTVRHYDSDFYHPPAGADVRQWIADRDMTYDEIDLEAEIAGLPMVHLIYEEGPGWDASDEYYFIRGDQLFSILILHTGGQQDWELYNKFLQSFTFP